MKALALCLPLVVGCAKTDSSDLLTSGIYAGMTAMATGNGTTTVSATLYVGNPINLNYVDLTGDDMLIAAHGTEEKVMIESQLLNIVSHTTSFDTDDAGDEFDVAFIRTVDDGAPRSTMTLPEKFEITPPQMATWSRQTAMGTTFEGPSSSDPMRWEARGDCIELAFDEIDPVQGFSIPSNRLQKRMGDGVADTCAVTFTVTRYRIGTVDPGYGKGGSVQGQQVRSFTITSTP